jgi:CHAT domain-containing protein
MPPVQSTVRRRDAGMSRSQGGIGARADSAQALADAAAAEERLGHFDDARGHLEEALAMLAALHGGERFAMLAAPRGDEHLDLLIVLHRIARVCLRLGRLEEARRYSERALRIAERAFGSDNIALVRPLSALAEALFALGRLDDCYLAVIRARTIVCTALGEDAPETAKAKVRLGVVLAELGDVAQAKALHAQALAVMRTHDRKEWIAAILASLAAIALKAEGPVAARPLYAEALATARLQFGDTHTTTGAYLAAYAGCLGKIGEERQADAMYDEAIAIMRSALGETHPEVATAMLDQGRLRYRSDPAAGRADVLRATAILGVQEHRPRLFAQAYLLLAQMLAPSSAAILFRKLAINEIEGMRVQVARLDPLLERTFLRQNEDEFRALGDVLIGQGRLPEAQQVLAMLKERELFGLTQIDARKTRVSLTALEALWVERGEALLAEIKEAARLHSSIDASATRLAAWLADLVAAFAAAEAGSQPEDVASAPRASTAAVRPLPGTALLQYLLAPDHLSASIILSTGDGQREHRLALADGELNRLVYAMRDAVQSRAGGFLDTAQRLYQLLIAPVAAELKSAEVRTLALSLDGALRYLPIAALHDGTRYLIEQFALVWTTVIAPAEATEAAAVRRATGLGVSQPVAGCAPLPGVREELAAVIRADGQAGGVLPGVIRLDEAFTADALHRAIAPANSVVHIASHFVFKAAQEASSYLLLGDGSRLTLSELAELPFQDTELVVLSACNTAIGGGHRQSGQESGREIEGLGAMVRHQGGRAVLATLWPVADLATAGLMRDFYRNRYEAGLAPAEALRRAQAALARDTTATRASTTTRTLVDPDEEPDRSPYPGTSHPFYWAPYILIGDATDPLPS